VVYGLCGKMHGTLGRGPFCTQWGLFLSSNGLFVSHSVYVRTHWSFYLIGSYIPFEVLRPPQWSIMPRESFYHIWLLSPWCLLCLVEIHFLWSFFDSKQSLVPNGIFNIPCVPAVSLGDFL